jgi:hypothetical protein
MNLDVTAVVLSLLVLAGQIYNAWMQRHQSPAQKDKDVIANYADLLTQYRLRIVEQEKEVDRLELERKEENEAHSISISNFEAVMKKRQVEYDQELMRVKKDLQDYQIGYASLRRVAVRYVPPDVVLPEVNGKTKDLK